MVPEVAAGAAWVSSKSSGEPKADGGKATSLVNAFGIQWIYDQVVFDYTAMTLHPEWGEMLRPEIVAISRKSGVDAAFNPKSEVTSGLQEMFLFFSGTIRPREGSKLEITPLLLTGRRSGLLQWSDLVKSNFMGGMQVDEDPVRTIDDDFHVVAAEIVSPKDAADKMQTEVGKLVAATKSGNEASVKAEIAEVNKACAGCHDNFRQKQ